MKLKEIKRPSSIPQQSYSNNMSLVGISGGLAFDLTACKEEVYHMVGKALGVKYDDESMDYIMGPSFINEKIDVKNPGIIIYTCADNKYSIAVRISKIISLLHKKHRLRTKPSVSRYKNSGAILIKVAKWYYKNSVSLSGMLTFIRAAANHDFLFETIQEFIEKMMDCDATEDGTHLYQASVSGNLKGFLEKSLPIITYRGNAWRWGNQDESPWDGLVAYDKRELNYYDISDGLSWAMA